MPSMLNWLHYVKFPSMHLKLIKLLESQLHEKGTKKAFENLAKHVKWERLFKRSGASFKMIVQSFFFFFFKVKNHFGMFKRFETLLIDHHGKTAYFSHS